MFKKRLITLLLALLCFIQGCQYHQNSLQSNTSDTTSEIHFIDTGNSDCIFIHLPDKNILIDAGDNDDEQKIVQYLVHLEITKIDYLISTHPDADHCGGLDAVVANFEIGQVFVCNGDAQTKTYQDFIYELNRKGLNPSVPLENQELSLGIQQSLRFYNTHSTSENSNDLSLITLFTDLNTTFLFTGDAGKEIEDSYILDLPQVNVLKVSHHGSNTGTSDDFIKYLQPDIAVIECGKDNPYGHPHQETIKILEKYNVEILRTDELGTIILKSNGKEISFEHHVLFDQNDSAYIGNLNSKKFHLPSCEGLPQENNRIYFKSRKQALDLGYEPCKKCLP